MHYEKMKNLYSFTNNKISIFEVERLGIDKSKGPSDRFFWFLFDHKSNELRSLKFISMSEDDYFQYRQLENVTLKFNSKIAEVNILDFVTTLDCNLKSNIDSNIKVKLEDFFRSI